MSQEVSEDSVVWLVGKPEDPVESLPGAIRPETVVEEIHRPEVDGNDERTCEYGSVHSFLTVFSLLHFEVSPHFDRADGHVQRKKPPGVRVLQHQDAQT